MPRLIAVIVALLALLGAGWWGWSNPDLLPESLRAHLPPARPEIAATRPMPRPAPAPAPAPAVQPPPAPVPALTPAPQDAPLPPETGSTMAIETERVAEAAIAAADARAEAQALARAEAEALQAAKTRLSEALAPLLAAGADPAAIRAGLARLTPPPDPLAARVQSGLVAEIAALLAETPAVPATAEASAAAPAPADDGTALIARIKDLLT